MNTGRGITPGVPGPASYRARAGGDVLVARLDQAQDLGVDVGPGEPAPKEQRSPDRGR